MITDDFIVMLFFAIVFEMFAICLLIYGIYTAFIEHDKHFFIGMLSAFIILSGLSGIIFYGTYKEYEKGIPENQIKILRQKIFDAEKEYQKYLIDHPELNEE